MELLLASGTNLDVALDECSKIFDNSFLSNIVLAAKQSIGVLNTPGTIDSDYRGELKVIIFNHGENEFVVNCDDRIAQMILVPVLKIEFEEVSELPETIRGSGGFGSTGK